MLLMNCLRSILRRVFGRKKNSYSLPPHATLNNSILADKRKHFKGEINLVYCRGHNSIMLLFYFEGFYDNHARKNIFIFRAKKWVVFSRGTLNQTLKFLI